MEAQPGGKYVLVTGASGFVGGQVVREIVARGHTAICPVRNPEKLAAKTADLLDDTVVPVEGSVFDERVLGRCLEHADAAIHLIGIILQQRRKGQTFERVHVDATRSVVRACEAANVKRYIHMSALGARPGKSGVSKYHQTKWQAEELVRGSPLEWTIFRPSLIHGPDGEFMEMMKFFSTPSLRQPVMPYFGDGERRIQPVYVKDVAKCFVRALDLPETVGKVYELGGPDVYTWKELYDVCARIIRGKPRWKVGMPAPVARFVARFIMPVTPAFLAPYKFDVGQVMMSQMDSVCKTEPVEETFGLKLRSLRTELTRYGDQIR